MSQEIFDYIHTRLAGRRFNQLWEAGLRGNIALQALAETADAARAEYQALPRHLHRSRWRRKR